MPGPLMRRTRRSRRRTCWRRSLAKRTSNVSDGRLKPVCTSDGSFRSSCFRMSWATCGVAVAVSASTGGRRSGYADGSESFTVRSARYAAEVVAPLGDAVRLVDDEEPDLLSAELLDQ